MKTLAKLLVGGLAIGVVLGAGVVYLIKNTGKDKKESTKFPEPELKSLALKEDEEIEKIEVIEEN